MSQKLAKIAKTQKLDQKPIVTNMEKVLVATIKVVNNNSKIKEDPSTL